MRVSTMHPFFFIITGIMSFLIIFACIVALFQDVICPKLFLRIHRITFDALDGKTNLQIVNFLREHHVLGHYEETEEGVAILTVGLFLWEEKKFLRDAKKLNNVEVF